MRSIRPQTITLAVLAILFGLGAAWAAKQVLLAKQAPPVVQTPPPAPRVPLLVLQSNLAADARIGARDVASAQEPLQKLKERNIPLDKALKFSQQAVGRILKHAKPAGSWLTEDDFYELGTAHAVKAQRRLSRGQFADRRSGRLQQHHSNRLPGRRDFHDRQSGRQFEVDFAFGFRAGSAQSAGERWRLAELRNHRCQEELHRPGGDARRGEEIGRGPADGRRQSP